MKLSVREACCLQAWNGIGHGYCLNFKGVARGCDIEPYNVRRVVRALARKGLVEFHRGLFDESDGGVAGAGYGLTPAGEAWLSGISEAAK
jgi:hypothetical protein